MSLGPSPSQSARLRASSVAVPHPPSVDGESVAQSLGAMWLVQRSPAVRPEACGLRPVARVPWPVAYSTVYGLWPTAWHVGYGLQHGIWPIVYSMAYGLWPTAWHVAYGLQHGMWPMAYSKACGLWPTAWHLAYDLRHACSMTHGAWAHTRTGARAHARMTTPSQICGLRPAWPYGPMAL